MRPHELIRVLVIDDSAFSRLAISRMLRVSPLVEVVGVARDGEEALRKTFELQPDLITLDLIMPEMSGLEVLSAIKDVSPKVPVMIITGNATDKLVNQAGVLGACRVMYKPVMLESFIAEMMSTLDRPRSKAND